MVEIRNEADLVKLKEHNELIQVYIAKYLKYLLKEYNCSDISQFGAVFVFEGIDDCKLHKEIGLSLPLDKAIYEFTDRLTLIGKNTTTEILHSCFVLTNDFAVSLFSEPKYLSLEVLHNLLSDSTKRIINIESEEIQ